MSENEPLAPHIEDIISDANEHFETIFEDAEVLKTKSLQDVEQDARTLERRLRELSNMARLREFYAGANSYARSCEKMDPNIMHLAWIWAPMTHLLEQSSAHKVVIDNFIRTFKELGQTLTRVNITPDAGEKTENQEVLALIYSSLLEVHCRLLALVQKQGYAVFFEAAWPPLRMRLNRIRHEIALLAGLLRQQDVAAELNRIREDRGRWRAEYDERERLSAAEHRKNVAALLVATEINQEDDLERISQQCHPGSCDWIFDNGKIKTWKRPGSEHNVIWLKGKPGSGKSVLSATIVRDMQQSNDIQVLYFICTENKLVAEKQNPGKYVFVLLRALVWQLVKKKPELATMVEAAYADAGSLSKKLLESLLASAMSTYAVVRIVVDGLDEREPKEQEDVYAVLASLPASQSRATSCKVLVSCRDAIDTPKRLRDRSTIDLSKEISARKSIEAAIATFVRSELLQNPILVNNLDRTIMTRVEQMLLDRANGMFLWVRLVLTMLQHATTVGQMLEYLRDLPPELNAIYSSIFARVLPADWQLTADPAKRHPASQASQIFQLLTYSKRPMKNYEIRDAVTMCMEGVSFIDNENRVQDPIFNHCKPLVEPASDDTVRFIHVSVKDYLLKEHEHFSEEAAQANITLACIKYLSNAINLIDPKYSETLKISDVVRGYHGLCFYASKHLIGHLLAYVQLAYGSDQSDSRELLLGALGAADALAQLIQHFAPYQVPADHGDKVDPRCSLLRERPALHAMVSCELYLFSDTLTKPHKDILKPQGLSSIQKAYEDIARRLLQSESLPGVDLHTIAWFKRTYSASMNVCRVKTCPRGLYGFATIKERDEHEFVHRLDLRCPYEDCPKGNPSFSSPGRRKAHLKQFHDDEAVKMPEPRQPTGIARVDTEATLVEDANSKDRFLDMVSLPPWEEDDEEVDARKTPQAFFESDQFALQTTTR